MKWWWGPLCSKTNMLSWIFIVLAHWNNSQRETLLLQITYRTGNYDYDLTFPGKWEMGITKPWSCLWSIQVRPISTRITDNTPRQVFQTKDFKIGICCFSAKHAVLRRKSKDWLARNQNNVSTRGLLFQWASTIKIQLIPVR
jgi:hypothetical protein